LPRPPSDFSHRAVLAQSPAPLTGGPVTTLVTGQPSPGRGGGHSVASSGPAARVPHGSEDAL
jgi:hypothetical protein